jgi:hypothetical protein
MAIGRQLLAATNRFTSLQPPRHMVIVLGIIGMRLPPSG